MIFDIMRYSAILSSHARTILGAARDIRTGR